MKKLSISFIILAILGSYTSCKKDTSASPSAIPQVSSMLRASSRSTVLNSISKDSLLWIAAKAQATMVKFEAVKSGAEIEFKSREKQAIDLFASAPLSGNMNIPAGTYDEVELRTILEPLSGQPSLELKADFTNSGVIIPVLFQSFETLEVKGERKNVTIDPGANYNLTTILDMKSILAGIAVSDLARADRLNGTIVISSSVNKDLYKKIVENLRNMEDECEMHRH